MALLPVQLLIEIHGDTAKQDVVKAADRASGIEVPLVILAVAVLAPVAEELLFRGALLRALMRKTTPGWAVFVSAVGAKLLRFMPSGSSNSFVRCSTNGFFCVASRTRPTTAMPAFEYLMRVSGS